MRGRSLAALGLVGLIVACGGRSFETEIDRHPAGVLPRGASQLAYVRIDKLRSNPLATLAYEKGRAFQWGQAFEGIARILDWAGEISRLALGTYGEEDRLPATVVVAAGRFDAKAFRDALGKAKVPHVENTYAKQAYYTCGRGTERCHVCFLSPGILVAASQEDLLKQTLDLRKSARKSMARDRGYAPILGSFSADLDLWATGMFPAPFTATLAQTLSPAVQYIQAFTIRMTCGETGRLSVALLCVSSEAAQANAQVVKKLVSIVPLQLAQLGYRIPQLETAIANSEIVVNGITADFQIALPEADVAAIAATLQAEPTEPVPLESLLPGGLPGGVPDGAPLGAPGALPPGPAPNQNAARTTGGTTSGIR